MKKIFSTLICLLFLAGLQNACAQSRYINFETDTFYKKLIVIDTDNYHNNIWQIGKPQKIKFDSALSNPNAIVTDTLNPYPANDTSVFVLKIPFHYLDGVYFNYWFAYFSFSYKLDIDTGARAIVEASVDGGTYWYNTNDALPHGMDWNGSKPDLSLSTTDWTSFSIGSSTASFDTLLLRFTFISGNVITGKEGWIIDDIDIPYIYESVATINNPDLISIYPNPSAGSIYLHTKKPWRNDNSIIVYDMLGRQVYSSDKPPLNSMLDLHLPGGIYTVRYSSGNEYCIKRIELTN